MLQESVGGNLRKTLGGNARSSDGRNERQCNDERYVYAKRLGPQYSHALLAQGLPSPHADGEFVSYAALERAIEKLAYEREAVEFLRAKAAVPSVRARVVGRMRGVFSRKTEEY